MIENGAHDNGIFDKLLQIINNSVFTSARRELAPPLHSIGFNELCVCPGNGVLVQNGKLAHPSSQNASRFSTVETLRPATTLVNCKSPALSGSVRTSTDGVQGIPVYLVFEHGGLKGIALTMASQNMSNKEPTKFSMLLRTHPYMTVAPFSQLPKFLHFGVRMLNLVFHRSTEGSKMRTSWPRRNKILADS